MKRMLPLILIFCIPVFLSAQQDDSFRLGIKGGPNFSFGTGDVESEIVTGSVFTLGFLMGGSAEFVPISWFSIEFDFLYSYANYGVEVNNTDKVTMSFSSLEMPLILKGRIPLGKGSLFLGAGPDFIFLIGKVTFKNGNYSPAPQAPDQVGHIALVVSAGYDWLLDSGNNFSLDVRYNRGFSSPLGDADIRANRIDLIFGWSVNL